MAQTILFPAAVFIFGAGGAALRVWELATAFEPDTGLPIPGAPASLMVILLSVLFALLWAAFVWRQCRKQTVQDFNSAFVCENTGYITAVVSAAAIPVCAAGLIVMDYLNGTRPMSHFIPAALFVFSAGSIVSVGRNNYRNLGQGQFSTSLLLPPFAFCAQLMLTYQTHSGNPVLHDYAYLLLALVCTVLGLYFMASFSFEKCRPAVFLWTAGLAVYFSCITVASTLVQALEGNPDWPNLALCIFSIVYFTVHIGVLLRNLTAKEETPHE